MFFMLAQAVDDPWDEDQLQPGCPAKDWAWVTREEAVTKLFSKDKQLSSLAHKMLSS